MKLTRTLVILDLETTGTWIEKDKIIEIAMIKNNLNGKRETFVQKVNPGISIPNEVTELTGISNEDIKDAPFFREIAEIVLKFIGDSDISGFNVAQFDVPIVKREIHDAGLKLELINRNIIDSKTVYHANEKRDLKTAYKFYCKKEMKNAHSALADASAALEILREQINIYGNNTEGFESLTRFSYQKKSEFIDSGRKLRFWNGDYYLTFGKYRNQSLREIEKIDRNYLSWLMSTDLSQKVKTTIIQVLNPQK